MVKEARSLFSAMSDVLFLKERINDLKRESQRERERKRESVHAWVTTHLSSPSN